MTYVAQLLPDLEEARIIREALLDFVHNKATPEQEDLCWGLIAKLTTDMRRNAKK